MVIITNLTETLPILSVVRCAAHTIQLAAHDVMKTVKDKIERVRKTVKTLRTIIKSNNLKCAMPALDNETRWNSTYTMFDSLFNIKENVVTVKKICVDWSFVKMFLNVFKPLADCTIKMQKQEYLLGDFYRDWLLCEIEVEEQVANSILANELYVALGIRKNLLLQHDSFVAALYLDPRYNFTGSTFLTETQKQTALIIKY